jgi:hypothetical protein
MSRDQRITHRGIGQRSAHWRGRRVTTRVAVVAAATLGDRRRRGRLLVHLDDVDRFVAALARRDFTGPQIDGVGIVAAENFEAAFEQGNRRRILVRRDVELRALDDSDEVRSFHAQLATLALADVVERIAARLHDAVDGRAALLERGEFELGIRSDTDRGCALFELDRAIGARAHGRGELEHRSGAHAARRAVHRDAHLALHGGDDDVAGIDRVRRRAQQQRERQPGHQPNYRVRHRGILVMTVHVFFYPLHRRGASY